jgi:hypothetical protein
MVAERLEVRLDQERRRKLKELAEDEEATVSETIRMLIDRAHEDYMLERRLAAVQRIANANAGEALEPEELNRLLNEAHSPGNLC